MNKQQGISVLYNDTNLWVNFNMDEKRVGIKVFTVVFFLLLIGFLSFLISEGCRDSEYKERMAPKERFKKNKDDVQLHIQSLISEKV